MIGQEDIIYFVLTDRFCDDGSQKNYEVNKQKPNAYHGGNFAGLITKIPYLKNLGVTAVWITPVYLNIHEGPNGAESYHGYWSLDFEKVDNRLYNTKRDLPEGSKQYLKELADALHQNNLKLVLDMVVNHTGYNHPGLRGDLSTPIRPYWFNPQGDPSPEKMWLFGLPDLNQSNPEVADYFVNTIIDWIEATRHRRHPHGYSQEC